MVGPGSRGKRRRMCDDRTRCGAQNAAPLMANTFPVRPAWRVRRRDARIGMIGG